MSEYRSDPRQPDHEEWDELAAGYALDALDTDEEVRFSAHVATCARCQASVDEHRLVAAQLGAIAHPGVSAEPPSWAAIRSSVVGDGPGHVAELDSRRNRRYDVSRRSLAAAAAVVILAGGGVAVWHGTTRGSSCSASAGCHTIALDAAGGHVAASLIVRDNTVTMKPTGMTAAPSGEVYVLWQQPRDGRAVPIAEFTAAHGAAPVRARLDAAYSDTQQFAVSLESAQVAPPTTPSNLLASGLAA